MEIKFINGGITAPKGFKCNGIHCGIRKNKQKKDLCLIVSDKLCTAAGVYTTNLVKGAPIYVTMDNIKDGYAQAIICNSGNANTCNSNGIEIATKMCNLVSKYTGINANDVIVASTGVIGQKLDITPISNGMKKLVEGLGDKSLAANEAIMTTDTIPKEVAVSFKLGGVECRIGCIAKGSGMIHPNMATMLVFVTTDVAISSEMLQRALKADTEKSFNMVSVDGDTSTNDMYVVLASGEAGNKEVTTEGEDFEIFKKALNTVSTYVCKLIAKDGEGATKLLECNAYGMIDDKNAALVAKSVITSSLFKAAMFGADANWGRVLCAVGYSGAKVDVSKIGVEFASKAGKIKVCENGYGVDFDEDLAKAILSENEIQINITSSEGDGKATAWGCDLTYDYVKINGDYRT